jgi:bifunctional pyridoxal-dependent enzyme with beta-cystathionase and maltose regulon repressor activities
MSPLDPRMKKTSKVPAWVREMDRLFKGAVRKAVKRQLDAGIPVYAVKQGKLQRING